MEEKSHSPMYTVAVFVTLLWRHGIIYDKHAVLFRVREGFIAEPITPIRNGTKWLHLSVIYLFQKEAYKNDQKRHFFCVQDNSFHRILSVTTTSRPTVVGVIDGTLSELTPVDKIQLDKKSRRTKILLFLFSVFFPPISCNAMSLQRKNHVDVEIFRFHPQTKS